MTLKLSTKLALATTAALTLGLAGCKHDNEPKMDAGFFKADSEPKTPDTFADAQAAAGARDDGMLYNRHFDGDQLNSLGRAKLELMARNDDSAQPVVVHLATIGAEDKLTSKRKEAIGNFLKDCGLTDEQIKMADGPNETTYTPSQNGLTNMSKTDTAASDTQTPATTGAPEAAQPTSPTGSK